MRDFPKIVTRGAGVTALTGVLSLISACNPSPQPVQHRAANEIVAAVRSGPASWFPGPDGEPSGFDHDLLVRFAHEHSHSLRIVNVASGAEVLAKVASGEADIGVGGLVQAASAKKDSL